MPYENLNKLWPAEAPNRSDIPIVGDEIRHNGLLLEANGIEVVFNNFEDRLVEMISQSKAVIGCVAWLTNESILEALALCPETAIVVQKEDLWRPDIDSHKRSDWKQHLADLYRQIEDRNLGWIIRVGRTLSVCGSCDGGGIRCMGNYNSTRKAAFPRMHHKFALFGDIVEHKADHKSSEFVPHTLWTGSYNWTVNAGHSLENALIVDAKTHPVIIDAFYNEFIHIFSLSEPLDFESNWVAPEWRIGT